jgi:hypothetical protein
MQAENDPACREMAVTFTYMYVHEHVLIPCAVLYALCTMHYACMHAFTSYLEDELGSGD